MTKLRYLMGAAALTIGTSGAAMATDPIRDWNAPYLSGKTPGAPTESPRPEPRPKGDCTLWVIFPFPCHDGFDYKEPGGGERPEEPEEKPLCAIGLNGERTPLQG